MSVTLDILGRHYVNRPVLYHTLLTRIVGHLTELDAHLGHIEHLSRLLSQKKLTPELMKLLLHYVKQSILLIREIAVDINTLIYKDSEGSEEEYDRLIKQIEEILRADKKVIHEAEEKRKQDLNSADKKELKKLQEELRKEQQTLKKDTALAEKIKKDKEELHSHLKEVIGEQYLEWKHHLRGTFSTEGLKDFDFRASHRLIILMRRAAIEKDSQNKAIEITERELKKTLDLPHLKKLDTLEARSAENDEELSHRISVIVSRLEGHLHEIHSYHEDFLANGLNEDLESTNRAVKKTIEFIFSQAKKEFNE